jgi:TDG/mug DNA glycosylase family protein
LANPWRPTTAQIAAARDGTIPDVLAHNLRLLFCGINPGLYSAAIGHHFGRPGNRFWPTLYQSGFTDRLYSPFEDRALLRLGLGITNLASRGTASANELTVQELTAGARLLETKARRYRPRVVAVVGVTAYRMAFRRPRARLGPQGERLAGVQVWVLPNPSGLNAHYRGSDLVRLFTELRLALEPQS